jgi:hypothetical protein
VIKDIFEFLPNVEDLPKVEDVKDLHVFPQDVIAQGAANLEYYVNVCISVVEVRCSCWSALLLSSPTPLTLKSDV